jgi:hypothetical protein
VTTVADEQGSAITGEVPPPEANPLVEDGGTPAKPRSGFARQKIKIQKLTELYVNMQDDYSLDRHTVAA